MHMAPGLKLSEGLAILLVGPVLGAPRIGTKKISEYGAGGEGEGDTERFIEVPVMFECDRRATIVLKCTNAFTKEDMLFSLDCPQCTPKTHVLGPFALETRYVCEIMSGVQHCPFMHFTISTHYHAEETNIAVINCEPYANGKEVCSHFVADLGARCSVPFSGITAVVHTNCTVDLDSVINAWLLTEAFVEEANICYRKRIFTEALRDYIGKIADSMRNKFRNFFARPSYRELLRAAPNILSPRVLYQSDEKLADELSVSLAVDLQEEGSQRKEGDDDEDDEGERPRSSQSKAPDVLDGAQAEDGESAGSAAGGDLHAPSLISHMTLEDQSREHVRSLLYLIATRLVQEYMCCLRSPEKQNFIAYSTRALSSHLANLALDDNSQEGEEGDDVFIPLVSEDGRYVYAVIPEIPLEQAVFYQWRAHLLPAMTTFVTWVSPNGRLSIEQLVDVRDDRQGVAEEALRRAPIEDGVRLFLLSSNDRAEQDPARGLFQGGYQVYHLTLTLTLTPILTLPLTDRHLTKT
mgnify:CR=1 FL=1